VVTDVHLRLGLGPELGALALGQLRPRWGSAQRDREDREESETPPVVPTCCVQLAAGLRAAGDLQLPVC
jgi:hypothetical protein